MVGFMVNQVHELGYKFLAFFEFISFFILAIFVVLEERHNKVDQLLNSLGRREMPFVIDHCFNNSNCYGSSVAEFHVLHQSGVVVHA